MLRTTLAVTLGAAVLAPITAFSGPAAAVADTCRGLPATIVGTPGEPITGTEGEDVIVSNNSGGIDALGGDDVVCLTNHDGTEGDSPYVDAGDGADVVDGTLVPSGLTPGIDLGDGADTYLGGPASDRVYAGVEVGEIEHWHVVSDDDQDVIDTGAGNDNVYTASDGPLTDQIDLGPGGGSVVLAADELADEGSLALGDEAVLRFLRPSGATAWYVNTNKHGAATTKRAAAGTVAGAPRLTWTGDPAIEVWGEQSVSFNGSARDDRVFAQRLVWASTGGGNDLVSMLTWEGEGLIRVVGGTGNDRLAVAPVTDPSEYNVRDSVVYDAAEGEATFTAVPDPATYPELAFWGIERHYVEGFLEAVLRGTPGVDQLVAGYLGADGATVYGGAGDDRIGYIGNGSTLLGSRSRLVGGPGNDKITNVEVSSVLEGGTGNDRLEGGSSPFGEKLYGNDGNDVLLGGAGPDQAWGGRGTDRCVAEQRTGCER